MLHSAQQLRKSRVFARDGSIGHVKDVYFDDEHWIIRFLVVDTAGWLVGRKVLIPPACICEQGIRPRDLFVNLTRAQVDGSPDVDTCRPVSRHHEMQHLQYYGYPAYWPRATTWAWGASSANPPETVVRPESVTAPSEVQPAAERTASHLRSLAEMTGYRVTGSGQVIGRARDVLFEERTWVASFVVVSAGHWWHHEQVTVASEHIDTIDSISRSIQLGEEASVALAPIVSS